jgi:ADP-ribosyl-[dinitrogen reductase] hydrolase
MTTFSNHQVQRGIGALVGSAVGDALGAPFEFGNAGEYSARFPAPVLGGTGEMVGGGSFGWKPGEFTDDTQMALALALSLLAREGFDPADLFERWRVWSTSCNDVGILTRQALRQGAYLGAALAAHESNGGKSASNGAVMRNTPVALFTAGQPLDEVWQLAADQAGLTHFDPDCAIAAGIQALMLRAGIDGQDMFEALDAALDRITDPQARARWAQLLGPRWTPDQAEHHNGTVWTCLAQAVWALRTSGSFAETVVAAIDLGDDTDTVACVAGGLAGARWGVQGIPSRWTTYVNGSLMTPTGKVDLNYAGLQDLAMQLMGGEARVLTPAEGQSAGPVRVHQELPVHAAEWKGASAATDGAAIVSACRTDGDFDHRPVRREVFLIDHYSEDDNHDALAALLDAVDTIDALLAEDPDRDVVVHCHGGRSRTAFILKGWAMRRHGWTEDQAHDWLVASWPRAHRDNPVFLRILTEDWPTA